MSTVHPVHTVVCRREPATSRGLLAQNAPERGVIVLTATPANEGLAPITRALLEAMGKDPQLTGGATCSTRYGWPLLAPWLLALGISDVVVDEAQVLPAKVLQELIVLVVGLGIRLWLVAHRPLGEDYPAVLAAWPAEDATTRELNEVLAVAVLPPGTAGGEPTRTVFPSVPATGFHRFRADCRDLLSASDFAIVDERYLSAADDARSWLVDAPRPLHAEAVARMLRKVLLDCSSPDEMLTVIRGSAAVLLFADILVTCGTDEFRAVVVDQPWYLVRRHPDWKALAGYRQPYRGAVCALAAAALPLGAMTELVCSEVANDGNWAEDAAARRARVPNDGRVYVRAQLLARQDAGASGSDLLFMTAEGEPATVRYLREALTEPTVEAGVKLASGRVPSRRATPMQWAARLGIQIQSLG